MLFDYTRGGQILIHNFEMFKEVIRKTISYSLMITILIVGIKFQKNFKWHQLKNAHIYMTAEHYYTNLKQPTRIFSVDGNYLEEDNKNNHQTIEKEIKNEYNKEVEIEQKEIEKVEKVKEVEKIKKTKQIKEITKEKKDKQMNSQNKNDDNNDDEELFN